MANRTLNLQRVHSKAWHPIGEDPERLRFRRHYFPDCRENRHLAPIYALDEARNGQYAGLKNAKTGIVMNSAIYRKRIEEVTGLGCDDFLQVRREIQEKRAHPARVVMANLPPNIRPDEFNALVNPSIRHRASLLYYAVLREGDPALVSAKRREGKRLNEDQGAQGTLYLESVRIYLSALPACSQNFLPILLSFMVSETTLGPSS